jgi:hypothetical protein
VKKSRQAIKKQIVLALAKFTEKNSADDKDAKRGVIAIIVHISLNNILKDPNRKNHK